MREGQAADEGRLIRTTVLQTCEMEVCYSRALWTGPLRATAGPGKPLSRGPIITHRRRKGGGSVGALGHVPKKWGKYFSGNYRVKFGNFRANIMYFLNFRANIINITNIIRLRVWAAS